MAPANLTPVRARVSADQGHRCAGGNGCVEVILRLEQVCKRYPHADRSRVALNRVSFELHRGQVMGIFGESGSGKTTLLRIAAGLEAPDSGVVTYKGECLAEMSIAQQRRYRRREVGCIWATQSWPPGLSVLEHVALPLLVDGCDYRAAERLSRKFLLACEAEQCIGVEPQKLSDGERQRVAIARALVIEPRMVFADGAVSNLSLVEQEEIMLLLRSLAREAKVAVLVTDTRSGSMLGAEPILYLREGKLAGGDPVAELGKVIRLPATASRRSAADA
jgi:ABC-type lipoprotein export system ATPase subunit